MTQSVSYHLPKSYIPLNILIIALCVIDLILSLFGGYYRHNLYVIGAGFAIHAVVAFITLALCLLLASSTLAFQLGNMRSVTQAVRSPFIVGIMYIILVIATRSYQLSVYTQCWRKPCPAPELAPAILTIWSPWMIVSHVLLKLGSLSFLDLYSNQCLNHYPSFTFYFKNTDTPLI